MRILILLGISYFLVACTAMPPINTPLSISDYKTKTTRPYKDNKALIVLTFSGGGVRAAAFSYGVLQGLNTLSITPEKNLLDEVDIISSVSGGSFTSAYYGLFGKEIFKTYKSAFLTRSVESEFINKWMLSPKNWGKMKNAYFTRSDLLSEYYDKHIFLHKTFADMQKNMPLIIINTTDISTGQQFAFTNQNMGWICSDLSNYPVSRAVMASSAVPVIFSPVVLKNYSGCNSENAVPKNTSAILFRDKKRYPYLHLIDGGMSDNLGIRGVLDSEVLQQQLKRARKDGVKQVIFVVVNAADEISPAIAQREIQPTLSEIINATATIQLKRYNKETLLILKNQIEEWRKQSNSCELESDCDPINFNLIELNFRQLPRKLADKMVLYKTALELEEEQVNSLIEAGKNLIINNEKLLKISRTLYNKKTQ